MNRGRVTKRQLDRDTLGRRGDWGDRRYRTTLWHRPTLYCSLGFSSLYAASPFITLSHVLYVISLFLFYSLLFFSYLICLSFSHTPFLSLPSSLMNTVLPRCLTPFSQGSCWWSMYSIYREWIKYLFASDDLTSLHWYTLHQQCIIFIIDAYGRTLLSLISALLVIIFEKFHRLLNAFVNAGNHIWTFITANDWNMHLTYRILQEFNKNITFHCNVKVSQLKFFFFF